MRRVISVHSAGTWPAELSKTTVSLAFHDRHRRRIRLTDDNGSPFLLDLQQAVILGDGDGLELDDGNWLAVKAVEEDVADVHCNNESALARIAWHLGNRHIPVQIIGSKLRIRRDHVIIAMLRGLGADVNILQAPFSPEIGAYLHQHARKDNSSNEYDHG